MFEGFERTIIETPEAAIAVRHGGQGPAVLLLHGFPQTHAIWHLIALRLAEHYTVVCTDLRGYGDSSKPPTDADHEPYSKRAMARDQIAVMRALGHERFAVVGHDRGGRCGYRLALDHPERVWALSVLDIIPTYEHFQRTNMAFALGYFHWFFLAQRYDLPERMIGADPDTFFLRGGEALFAPEAWAEYRRCFHDPATIHAMCEDYRAGAGIDRLLDEADKLAGRRLLCPVQALWGSKNGPGRWYDVLAVWREWASVVEGSALDCGHYLPEEKPDETYAAVKDFLERCARFR
ncbi:MAG: alpha/beta hydrolase [Polyangiales bacterium]